MNITSFLKEKKQLDKLIESYNIGENTISIFEMKNETILRNIIIEETQYSSIIENSLVESTVLTEETLDFSENEDVYLDVDSDLLTEVLFQQTVGILNESGSLPDVEPVPLQIADKIVQSFVDTVLTKIKVVRNETIAGLGSTRAMLSKLPNAKAFGGDIDLLAVAITDNRIAAKELSNWAIKNGLDYQVAFGNIFSVAYPYKGSKYQIDLMIANPSADDSVYQYMRKFKYFSDEDPIQNTDFILKGAHRSELAKTMVKAVGLSASENGFKQFSWNGKFKNIDEVVKELDKKAKRFRDPVKKEQTIGIANVLVTRVRTLEKLENELTENGILKDRYPNIMFRDVPKGFDVLLDLLFDKADVNDKWEKILDKKFGITDAVSKMKKFEDVIEMVKLMLKNRIFTPRAVVGIFNEIKSAFDKGKAAGTWSPSLEKFIETKLPVLKNRWNQ